MFARIVFALLLGTVFAANSSERIVAQRLSISIGSKSIGSDPRPPSVSGYIQSPQTLSFSFRFQDKQKVEDMNEQGNFNLKLPTLGGKQVWTDHRWWYGWRIQENLLTGHWRLIDDRNIRHAWGTREACEKELNRVVEQSPKDAPEKVVILLHGLMRSSDSMAGLQRHLEGKGFPVVVGFGYASSRSSISDHAAALREVVAALPGKPQLYFSGHSMGNIVLRHAIGDWQRDNDQETLERIQSVVMLGPPNQGAAMAKRLAKTGVFGIVTGTAGLELGPAWEQLEQKLATPPCRFGIVMGDVDSWSKFNPLLEGPSDLIVTVEEAKLDGASEMLTVPDLHSFLMDDKNVQQAVARFFQGGALKESQQATNPSAEPPAGSE